MSGIFSSDALFAPTLTQGTQAIIRVAYGILLLLTLLQSSFQRRRFFVSERWGGYAQSGSSTDWIQSPIGSWCVLVLWIGAGVLLTIGVGVVWAALVNLLFARYFFVSLRWRGVLRGMGAPGFMTYWLGAVVFLLEFTSVYAPAVRPLALLVAQIDFAFIMLSAGVYKLTAGYARNHGMEYGLVNPEWGYWWQAFRRLRPGHPLFRLLNHLAWGTEVFGAILMLVPATRFLGGVLMFVSFAFIAAQIRLGFLCEMVMAAALLFCYEGSVGGQLVDRATTVTAAPLNAGNAVVTVVSFATLAIYLVLLPAAHAGLFYNFYGRRRLPGMLQKALDRYTNLFGLIIWRVFSVDVVNFYILIYRYHRDHPEERRLVSRYGWRGGFRFSHVGECIAITSLFTTLKYYPSNPGLFVNRLLRYSRTIPCRADEQLLFEYVSILKSADHFSSSVAAEYLVDVTAGTVAERILDPTAGIRSAHSSSPVHEGVRPGTYIPLQA